ncbi:non-ribosomal peptide synthetase, partial [Pseudomonas oryzihabitans]
MTDLPTPAAQLRAIAERLASLPEARQLDFLRQLRQKGVRLERLPIVRQATTRAPLSAAQRRLWFLWQLDPQSPAYNLPSALRLRGSLDRAALARTFAALERQHPSLRTLFETDGNAVWQRIRPAAEVALHELSLTAPEGAARESEARERLLAAALQPFDLAKGPLLRVTLVRLAADDHLLLINVHHIIADGWSLDLLQRDFATLYAAYSAGAEPQLATPLIDYSDHARWQSLWLAAGEGERQLAFWREHLGDGDRPLALPTDRPRPPQQSYRGASRTLTLTTAEVTALRELSRGADASLFMVLLAGFKAVLARFSGQGDIRVGIPVAGRTRSETREVVGLFVNTQVLHSHLTPRQSFADLLVALRRNVLVAQDHQDLPFEQVVAALRPERSLAHNPLFQVAYNHLARQAPAATLGELRLEPLQLDGEIAKFDLMLTTEEQGADVRLVLAYATDLFEAATAERLLEHLRRLLSAACRAPQRALADLAELPAAEWSALQAWNATAAPLPAWTLTRAFEAQVQRTPTASAVVAGDATLDYATLNQRANRLARLLRARGVGPEVAVGVALERTPELLVALLAVLKAGGAYVPLDPEFPTERLRLMLEDSQAALLLTQASLLEELPATTTPTWCLDRDAAALADQADTDLAWTPRAEDLAYVIYTSGSTGTPKGVAVRHGGLANFLASMARSPGLAASDRLLGLTSLSFDIAGLELYLPLLVGARVVLVSHLQARDPELLLGEIRRQGVSVIQATPSTWRLLLEHPDFACLDGCRLLCGGEALPDELATRLASQGTALWNLYGPTETTIWSAACAVAPEGPPSLGQPLANTSLWVLDAALNPVPLGAAGELYIGGAGLARGYQGRPGLTAERFVADPFGPPGARLYRTGDLARWRADGRLDYLGRLDQQVKIRGLRIELGEIEACLNALPGVREAAVVVRRQGQAQHLVGYWVDAAAVDDTRRQALKAALAERLPDYMVPTQWVALARLPRTPNGKLDRQALPEPEWQGRALRLPQTPAEVALAAIWQRVLGVEQVGLDDNFFESGGDSIVSIQVVSQACEAGWQLTPRQVFQHQTLAALAAAAQPVAQVSDQPLPSQEEGLAAVVAAGLDPALFERVEPLGPLQLGLLYQALLAGDGTYVNQLRLDVGGLDVAAFTAAWQAALERHASLRTAFFWEGRETPLQAQRRQVELPLTLLDWRDRATCAADLEQLATEDRQRAFGLAEAPLLRLTLVRCGDDVHHLIYTNHHLLLDGWSNAQLLAEVLEQYGGGQPAAPQGLGAYRAWRAGYAPAAGEAFWRAQLAGLPAPTRLAASAPTLAAAGVAQLRLELPAAATAALVACARSRKVTLNTLLQAAWTLLLQRHTGQATVACGVVLSGRPAEVPGIQRQLGLFINTLPLIVSPPAAEPLGDWLPVLQELNLALREHEQVPLQDIQRWAGQGSDGLFDTLLVFENYPIAAALAQAPATLKFSGVRTAELNHYPLTLMVGQGETLRLRFDYRLSHFSEVQVQGFARQLDGLLQCLPELLDQPLGELCLLDASERQTQVEARNRTTVAYPRTPLLPALLAEQAQRSPQALAVVQGARRLDYAEFDAEANRLAHWLIAQGVGPDVLVGVAAERSVELVLALVAVLKAGGAYVPLDPDHPAERLAYQLEDSQVRLLLTQRHLQSRLPASAVPQLLLDDRSAWQDQPAQAPSPALHGEHLAYVLYTSGSTGRPKGAGNTQAALLNRLQWMQEAFQLREGRRVLQKTPFSFDVSVWEFFWPLLTGATLVVAEPGAHRDPRALREVIAAEGVQVLHFVPSMLQAFL